MQRFIAGAAMAVAIGTGFGAAAQTTLSTSNVRAVATYESVGLYFVGGSSNGCSVRYRVTGTSAWKAGLDMWYDSRDNECRGSLVGLTPATSYDVEMGPAGSSMTNGITFSTWSNSKKVAKTIAVGASAGTLVINEGGSASTGYVVYEGNGATLDAGNGAQYNVQVNASYVIVRGLVLKAAMQDAIRVSPSVTDVIIEDNDISGWGRTRDGKWGADMDSGVRAVCSSPTMERITIQRNRIHDPRYPANSWTDGHPAGAQGITFSYCGGNHVIRHNEIYSNNGNRFNDGIGGEDNFTKTGFPNADSDIYGNSISNTWDDGIEAEGGNENVRIWGNYIDQTAIGIATTVVSVGPAYIFRNVWNRAQMYDGRSLDQDDRQPMMKAGSDSANGFGRRYVFHNTMLQNTQSGLSYPLGGGFGAGGAGVGIWNTISKNNIWHTWKANTAFYETRSGSNAERDMYNGTPGDMTITDGINAAPTYASGNGPTVLGMYQLASGSPGFDQAVVIPNFNDTFNGAGPDVGAHEAGSSAMKFGIAASAGSAVSGSNLSSTTGTGTGTGVTTPPTGTGTGTTGTTGGSAPTTGAISMSASAIVFSPTGLTQTVTYTNTSSAKVVFMQASMSSPKYNQSNNCGDVQPGDSCTATITFFPTYSGADAGTLTVTSSAPNSPHVVSLAYSSGNGSTSAATIPVKGKRRVLGVN